ncbi:hypothetical protein GIY11_01500 [Aerococcaceae bacterium DSM 109653]|uniref:Uncharacterized protein n=1 Tax=Fundicoccus ignavus TaxID=2664442 RepID=A0A844BKN7_9LACT|nr:hypothetical protein [Fundicoccus ignavus]MRI80708.1 hypothetical protein [Fundicoccus ignavus]
MNLKNRLKKLEEMTLTVNQEDKIISFLEAVEAYINEDSSGVVSAETAKKLEDSASEFNFGKNLIKGEK